VKEQKGTETCSGFCGLPPLLSVLAVSVASSFTPSTFALAAFLFLMRMACCHLEKTCSLCYNCHIRVSDVFGKYDHRPPMGRKDRCRSSLKRKLKSHGDALHGTSVSAVLISAKLHCFNKCLLAQG